MSVKTIEQLNAEAAEAKKKALGGIDAGNQKIKSELNGIKNAEKAGAKSDKEQIEDRLWEEFRKCAKEMKEPQKGFDNFQAAMAGIMELGMKLHYALKATIDSDGKLLWAIELTAEGVGLGGKVLGSVLFDATLGPMLGFKTPALCSNAKEWAMDKLPFPLPATWREVKLPDAAIRASSCDHAGKLTFTSLAGNSFSGVPESDIKLMDELNECLQKAFLAEKGYTEKTPGIYTNRHNAPLTSAELARLKALPDDGLKAFVKKSQRVTLTDRPLGADNKVVNDAPPAYTPPSPGRRGP
jgi:hypothetical protein